MCGHARYRETPPLREVVGDDIRASDSEREQVVSDLRTHAGDGRLTVEELEARVDQALAARTRGELAGITRDLPGASVRARPATEPSADRFRPYVSVMVLLVAIWALTGAGYPWFVWPALGWGIALLLPGGGCSSARHRRRLHA